MGRHVPTCMQMMPDDVKYQQNSTIPMFTNNEDFVLEKGTQVRLRIRGLRSEVGNLYGIGTMAQDYLGYVGNLRLLNYYINRVPEFCLVNETVKYIGVPQLFLEPCYSHCGMSRADIASTDVQKFEVLFGDKRYPNTCCEQVRIRE